MIKTTPSVSERESSGSAQPNVSQVRALYEEFTFPLVGNHKDFVTRYVQPHIRSQPKTILDAGCGTGNSGRDIARNFPQSRMLGIDFSENSLQRAREFAATEGLGNVTYRFHDLMQPFPLADGKYDLIISLGVVHHTPDPIRALRHLRAVAADDGQFILAVYGKYGRIETEMRRELVNLLQGQSGISNREFIPLVTKLFLEPVLQENTFHKAGAPRTVSSFVRSPGRLAASVQRRMQRVRGRKSTSGIPREIGIADQYLHPVVHNWSAAEWFCAAENEGFILDGFAFDPTPSGMCIPQNAVAEVRDLQLRGLLSDLELRQQYAVLELIFRPTMHVMLFNTARK